MNRTKEIELLTNPAFHTMAHNGYINTEKLLLLMTFLI